MLIERLPRLVPVEMREAVLTKASDYVRENIAECAKHDGLFRIIDLGLADDTGLRHYDEIKRLKAHAVLMFTRDIVNNSPPSFAAQLLFGHKDGLGSGYLLDYLACLPGITISPDAMKDYRATD